MILDILKTAARFPNREGVLKCFNLGDSNNTEYKDLRKDIEELPPSLIPEIEDFVFGVDEEEVKRKINNISGTFLFVDFGDIISTYDNKGAIVDTFQISMTIARKVQRSSCDMIAEAIVFDRMLQLVADLKRTLISEKKKTPWLAQIEQDCTCSPFVARELGCIGWSLIFERKGLDLLNMKRP